MLLGCLSILAVVGSAAAAGLGHLSLWWALIPIVFAAWFALSNDFGFGWIIRAKWPGRLAWLAALAWSLGETLALAAIVYVIARSAGG